MTNFNDLITDLAIEIALQNPRMLNPGDTAAHKGDPLAYEFVGYECDLFGNPAKYAVLRYCDGLKLYPAEEVFDLRESYQISLAIKKFLWKALAIQNRQNANP